MEFYHTLRLGLHQSRPAISDHMDGTRRKSDTRWRERLNSQDQDYEERPESAVLDSIRHSTLSGHGVQVIFGEPGAGMTTLLEQWHVRWIAGLKTPRLLERVPVMIRMKDVTAGELCTTPAAMAERLWERGLAAAKQVAKDTLAAKIFDLPGYLFAPTWFLDGLDEAQVPINDRSFWERLAALPGNVVATCRTAVYQIARQEAARSVMREFCILGVRRDEQLPFLTKALAAQGQAPVRAPELVRWLNANPALRSLASVPLLLHLSRECPTVWRCPWTGPASTRKRPMRSGIAA
jgi:hypothetical protein